VTQPQAFPTVLSAASRAAILRPVAGNSSARVAGQTSSVAAPEHGEHTEEILSELLGYGKDALAAMRARGVI
jgi:crotonobetainyl-CoA:carnitine CoA-transferase CaiB-like acyl-CoA transferase